MISNEEPNPDPPPAPRDRRDEILLQDLERTSIIGELGDRAVGIFRLKLRYYVAAGTLMVGGYFAHEKFSAHTPTQPEVPAHIENPTTTEPDPCLVMMKTEIQAGVAPAEASADYYLCQKKDFLGN